ncbi:carbohydrate kinase [Nonomuraea sp. NPDC001023]|uniref:carbohydrate kinase family protein n=1 Tax=unclassified Nonomuraea TaxID=2593643 RepID=UPI0033223999
MTISTAPIVVVGETLVDLLWRAGTDTLRISPGGSPANVALGLRRLGCPVSLLTCWGDDPPGQMIKSYLADTGLDVVRIAEASRRSTVALAYLDADTGSATYEFVPHWAPETPTLSQDVILLHTGSLAVAVEPGAQNVLNLCIQVHRQGCTVSIDLNVRPAVQPDHRAYRSALERFVAVADVVKASDEDLRWLWPEHDPQDSARRLRSLGPRLVVLTRGAAGATAYTALAQVSVPAPSVEVVDTVGAGDAFQAALLDGLVRTEAGRRPRAHIPDHPEALRRLLTRAVLAGALATTREGAQPPHRWELSAAAHASQTACPDRTAPGLDTTAP